MQSARQFDSARHSGDESLLKILVVISTAKAENKEIHLQLHGGLHWYGVAMIDLDDDELAEDIINA